MSYIYINGLTLDEIVMFTEEVAASGDKLELPKFASKLVDKHSTGGVGDKITLILLPIMAALDIPVAKISSKGLGIAGGTIDKLNSIVNICFGENYKKAKTLEQLEEVLLEEDYKLKIK